MIAAIIVGHLVFDVIAALAAYLLHHHSMDKLRHVLEEIAGENLRLRHVIRHKLGRNHLRKAGINDPNWLRDYQDWLADSRSKKQSS